MVLLFSFSCLVGSSSSSFGWCCFFPCLLLRGAAWSPPSLALFSSPFTWCCLVSSLFGWCCCSPSPVWWCSLFPPPLGGAAFSHVFCWVVLLGLLSLLAVVFLFFFTFCFFVSSLRLGGFAVLPSPFGVVLLHYFFLCSFFEWCCCSPSPVWCCLPPPPLGGAAFSHVFCCVVLLGLLLPWRCFPLLLRGAAWFLPSLGGVAVLLFLFGGVVFFLLRWVGLLFPMSSVGWCCLVSSPSLALFSSFFTFCFFVSSLRLGGFAVLPSPFGGVLLHYFLLCSFFEWCCCSPSPVWWGLPPPPLGGAAFSHFFCCVVLLGLLLPLRCFPLLLRGAAWSPPSFGGVAVFPSPIGWCCLPSPPLDGAALSSVFCGVVLLGFLPPFGRCCCCSFSCWVQNKTICVMRRKTFCFFVIVFFF